MFWALINYTIFILYDERHPKELKVLAKGAGDMPFSEKQDPKQRIALSEFAKTVVENDLLSFELLSTDESKGRRGPRVKKDNNIINSYRGYNGFINKVFSHYYRQAEASISFSLARYDEEIADTLSEIHMDEETRMAVVQIFREKRINDILKKVSSYTQSVSFLFTLNNANYEYLTGPECIEDRYYKRRGAYIKAVIEEYARLHSADREIVYFSDHIKKIEDCIKNKRQILIDTQDGRRYRVYPYKVYKEPGVTGPYLIGYKEPYKVEDGSIVEKSVCALRISQLKSIKETVRNKLPLSITEKSNLNSIIKHGNLAFTSQEETKITVKFTENGERKYRSMQHLRPSQIVQKKDNVWSFNCTQAQAEFYFTHFGADVEVLEPLELREKFAKTYEKAAALYKK